MERIIQIAALLILPLLSAARTWYVGPGEPCASIRQAVGRAAPGDTVLVRKGIYLEKGLVIDRRLCLKGIGQPILDGEKKYEIISIKADGVTVEGFLLQHSGVSDWNDIAGVRIYGAKHVIIRNNVLDDTFFGIYSQHADSCIIAGNTLRSRAGVEVQSGNGIHCWKCDGMQIVDNVISHHRDGIYFEFVTNSLIRGNQSMDNIRYGLHFMFSHHDIYKGNLFRHNEAGVSVMFSHGVSMLDNTFSENGGGGWYGILMKEITDSRVDHNVFNHNTSGIYMEGTTRVVVTGNAFTGNGWALKIQASCADNTITRNNFRGNTFDVATNGTLVLNNFDNNYWDKYEGYDLNRDGIGDVPYHPVSMYAMIAEKNPAVMMLFHSFMVSLMDRTEKVIPSITPATLKDDKPSMKPLRL
ncbi:nitrous oxide reductase family maturation protein NosD [Flavitalea sp. BT771]|uniref:nitrous oxide reductase family maturation protein NosD n=1 Tax=Flavitalea sp. BT771 TaxID=3063329 RepID=UPI0026E1D375|nr:nitrous oxide reductase family maturation protein NosD [Flavitalea sp. BT771]MDO6430569.1 nitrous oxide reductase family maturation protein NosD [Flavitalea sp. BT771]MDV6219291.1 nitrous oxide reductase family maturation protein NosD [Flavitalea sp. BT771]